MEGVLACDTTAKAAGRSQHDVVGSAWREEASRQTGPALGKKLRQANDIGSV